MNMPSEELKPSQHPHFRGGFASFGKPNGQYCDECGTELIDRCWRCGAPVCCPKCCDETMKEAENAE